VRRQRQGLTDSLAGGRVHRDSPLVEQPLRYVAPVPIALAPFAQFHGASTGLLRESQLVNLHFELSGGTWSAVERLPVAPVRISASARHSTKRNANMILRRLDAAVTIALRAAGAAG
jgi:hypothetical protein